MPKHKRTSTGENPEDHRTHEPSYDKIARSKAKIVISGRKQIQSFPRKNMLQNAQQDRTSISLEVVLIGFYLSQEITISSHTIES